MRIPQFTGIGVSSDGCCRSLFIRYSLAVQHALETTTLEPIPLEIRRPATRPSQNPYILPFAMRGLLEEDYVRGELQSETDELLKQFDNWKPASKVLKNVKFRLEGIRSKL